MTINYSLPSALNLPSGLKRLDDFTRTERTITIARFLELLEQNGHPWGIGSFQDSDGTTCAVGQVMRNLGYTLRDDHYNKAEAAWETAWYLNRAIYQATRVDVTILNDESKSFADAVQNIKAALQPYSDVTVAYEELTQDA